MNKSLLAIIIAACFSLTACGDKKTTGNPSHDSVIDKSLEAETKINFDLLSEIPVVITPSFIAMDPFDGTIDSEKTATDPNDQTDPAVAMGKNDGWSISQPITISFTGEPLDKTQDLSNVFKIMITNDPTAESQSHKRLENMLVYGEDYSVEIEDFSLTIKLLKPLLAASNYMYALTSELKDNKGQPVGMTLSYAYLKSSSTPPSPELGAANTLTNRIEARFKAHKVNPDTIIYASWFTTESIGASLTATKAVIAKVLDPSESLNFADIWHDSANPNNAALDDLYKITLDEKVAGYYEEAFKTDPVAREMIKSMLIADPSICTTFGITDIEQCTTMFLSFLGGADVDNKIDVYHGTVTLPIFSTTEVKDDLWSTTPWQSATPSVAKIKRVLSPGSEFSEADKQAVTNKLSELNIDTQKLFNLDINELIKLSGQEITLTNGKLLDEERLITKYSPIPKIKSVQDVPIIFFAPSDKSSQSELSKITVFQHGITGLKELAYLFVPTMEQLIEYKTNRTAIVAIDTYLHGERGLEDPDGAKGNHDIVTNSATPDVFMNLAHLTVGRDNLRQSIIDTIGLRVALSSGMSQDNIAGEVLKKLDQDKISYYGHSMGAISGISSYSIANQAVINDKALNDRLFKFTAGAFANPGGNIASVLLESETLGPVVKHGILLASEGKYSDYANYKALCGDKSGFVDIKTCLDEYTANLGEPLISEMETMFSQFSYAAQTVMDTVDPLSLSAKVTGPVYLMEAAGDQVVPNQTSKYSALGGTEPLATALHLDSLKESIPDDDKDLNIIARFNSSATHTTAMMPMPSMLCMLGTNAACPAVELNFEIGTFLAQDGRAISVDNPDFLLLDLNSDLERDNIENIDNPLNILKYIDPALLPQSVGG
ncbi:putative lipase [Moritella sp. JT01]|uniref:VolA/Pla-1 family phospholipase n=1 Tax=Moritella sp. JT01 TaxID=756698 RepID=UPI000796FE08|nr:VolA/Pla-1 family phospholipase [Moritella sp. JT01]KXO12845.1 putative lipase [Moritella sp. JT01]